jgi:Fe-S-cluster containining protein
VFLGADGHCGVYAHRPEGCRLYPLVWSQKERRVVRDDFCPYSKEFPIDPKAAAHLETVLATIEREAAVRKGKVYGASSSSSAGDRLGS